jgi:hypothetical protein
VAVRGKRVRRRRRRRHDDGISRAAFRHKDLIDGRTKEQLRLCTFTDRNQWRNSKPICVKIGTRKRGDGDYGGRVLKLER